MVRCQSLHRNENTGKGMFNLLTAAAYESYEVRDSPEYALDRLWGIQTWSRGCLSKTFPSLGSKRSSAVMKASRNSAHLHALCMPQMNLDLIEGRFFLSSEMKRLSRAHLYHRPHGCQLTPWFVLSVSVSWAVWDGACWKSMRLFPLSLAPFPLFHPPVTSLPFTWNFLGFTIRGFLFIWSNYFASWLGSSTRCNLDLSQLQICCMFFFHHLQQYLTLPQNLCPSLRNPPAAICCFTTFIIQCGHLLRPKSISFTAL